MITIRTPALGNFHEPVNLHGDIEGTKTSDNNLAVAARINEIDDIITEATKK